VTDHEDLRELRLRRFRPVAAVRTAEHQVPRARFPAIDVHNHLGRWLTSGWASLSDGRVRLSPEGWLRLDALAAAV